MSGSVNKVILVGNLGQDPEVRTFSNGSRVVTLRIATSERWKDQQGERKERTEWHTVSIYAEGLGRTAENYLRKGSKVFIEGKLEHRKWKDSNDVERYSTEIAVRNFAGELTLLDGRGQSGNQSDESNSGRGNRSKDGNGNGKPETDISAPISQGQQAAPPRDVDDEIPF